MNLTTNIITRRLALAAAAALLHAAGASAAPSGADAQAQARALLTGASSLGFDAARALPAVGSDAADPQEQARRLLGGKPAMPGAASVSSTSATDSVASDKGMPAGAQEWARRMILGRGA